MCWKKQFGYISYLAISSRLNTDPIENNKVLTLAKSWCSESWSCYIGALVKVNLGESFLKSLPIHCSEASLSFNLGKIQRIICVYFDGQIGDKNYRTVEYLERRASGKGIERRMEEEEGRLLIFKSRMCWTLISLGMSNRSWTFLCPSTSTPNMPLHVLLENKINLPDERKRLIEQVS